MINKIATVLQSIKKIDAKNGNNLDEILNNFNIGRYKILVSDKPLMCYAYTKWNILGDAIIVIDKIVFEVPNTLEAIILHEIMHVKQGYWKSWLLLFFRRKIENTINKEVERFLNA